MLKIALIGYGQMGKLLQETAPGCDCEVVSIIDPQLKNDINPETLNSAEVAIDFSIPAAVRKNVEKLAPLCPYLVIGTTGWSEQLTAIRELTTEFNLGIVYGSNFSPGMNHFYLLVEQAAQQLGNIPEYDSWGLELHHKLKMDSPSGTARELAEILISASSEKKTAQFDRVKRPISKEELHFASIRAGQIPGTHIIGFDSEADSLELRHTAHNRHGFALGAIQAAHWIKDRPGFFNFRENFRDIFGITP